MGSPQSGLPLLSALPKQWPTTIIDLKDCFFSIPLHPLDSPRFAFSVPSVNHEGPDKRYQWVVLPQGMKNSPTMCQHFLAQILDPIRTQHPQVKFIHYMDDLLLTGPTQTSLTNAMTSLLKALQDTNLQVSPEKFQDSTIGQFLGCTITPFEIKPQKLTLRTDTLTNLHEVQQFIGDITWLRPFLKLSNSQLRPLYELLKGDSQLASPRVLTPEARQVIQLIQTALATCSLRRWDPMIPILICILKTPLQPTAVIWQQGPLQWIHPKFSPCKILSHYPTAVAQLAQQALLSCLQAFGAYPSSIKVPYSEAQLQVLYASLDEWSILRCTFPGIIDNQLPGDPILHFVQKHPVIFPKCTKQDPIPDAITVFTDGSQSGVGAYYVEGHPVQTIQFTPDRPQIVELQVVANVLCKYANQAINILSDSNYVVNAVAILETVGVIKSSSTVADIFKQIQDLLYRRQHPFFISHIRAHTGLPGPLSEGNHKVDIASRPLWAFLSQTEQALRFHSQFHVNATTLSRRFTIPRQAARDIVRACADCTIHLPVPSFGVNPRGLAPNDIWQMDVTHIPSFGSLKYVHVSIDTCSHIIFASAETGEKTSHVIQHCLSAWAAWGKPNTLKTDNGPAYTSKTFKEFCDKMQVRLIHGIPYNPQGQGIIERAHHTVKTLLTKQKGGIGQGLTAKQHLSMVNFTLNFLNLNSEGLTRAEEHTSPPIHKGWIKWRDVLSGQWRGPDPVLSWSRGAVCVSPQNPKGEPVWVPERLTRRASPAVTPEDVPTTSPDGPHSPITDPKRTTNIDSNGNANAVSDGLTVSGGVPSAATTP